MSPLIAPPDAKLITVAFRPCMWGWQAWMKCMVPSGPDRHIASASSSVVSRKGTRGAPAMAVFTRLSIAPNASTVARTASSTWRRSPTSHASATASPAAARISSATAAPRSLSRSTTATRAPSVANMRAMPRPMPWPAPVTMATFPASMSTIVPSFRVDSAARSAMRHMIYSSASASWPDRDRGTVTTSKSLPILLGLPPGDMAGGDPAVVVDTARRAEEAGFAGVVISDHVVMGARTDRYPWGSFKQAPDCPWPEPLTVLTAVAAVTTTLRLCTGILIAPLRPATLLAKTAATLDVLSHGRLELGVGTGWQQEEFDAQGLDAVGSRPAPDRHDRRLPGPLGGEPRHLLVGIGLVRRHLVPSPTGQPGWAARALLGHADAAQRAPDRGAGRRVDPHHGGAPAGRRRRRGAADQGAGGRGARPGRPAGPGPPARDPGRLGRSRPRRIARRRARAGGRGCDRRRDPARRVRAGRGRPAGVVRRRPDAACRSTRPRRHDGARSSGGRARVAAAVGALRGGGRPAGRRHLRRRVPARRPHAGVPPARRGHGDDRT